MGYLSSPQIDTKHIKSGHIIHFEYHRRKTLAFVLNPAWQKKVHVLKMNEMPYVYFAQIFERIKTENDDLIRDAIAESRAPVDTIIRRPKLFYNTVIKHNSVFNQFNMYRTYFKKDIRNLRIVVFDFGVYIDDVEDLPAPGEDLV